MKKFLSAVASTAFILLLAGCNKATPVTSDAPPDSQPAPPPPAPPTPAPVAPGSTAKSGSPEKTPPVSTGEPEAPKKVLAPEGTLFAVERISISSEDGIRAVNPGTRLKVVRKTATGFMVTDGKGEFEAQEHQVTNEMTTATAALQTHRADTSANAAATQAQSQATAQLLQAQQQQAAMAEQAAAKDKRIRDLNTSYDAFVREEVVLTAKVEQARQEDLRAWDARSYGRVYTRTVDTAGRANWVARLSVIKGEKVRVQNELARLQ